MDTLPRVSDVYAHVMIKKAHPDELDEDAEKRVEEALLVAEAVERLPVDWLIKHTQSTWVKEWCFSDAGKFDFLSAGTIQELARIVLADALFGGMGKP